MNTTAVIIVAVIILVATGAWAFLRRPASSPLPLVGKAPGAHDAAPVPKPEEENSFEIGLNPASDGITTMYALETCRHCRRTREFLEENKMPFHIVYVDQFIGDQRSRLMEKVRSYNPRGSFPTVILPNGKAVVGYREQLLREALLHDTPSTT